MLHVAALTGGANVPSARFRVRQYIAALRHHGIDLTEYASFVGSYPPRLRLARPLWGLAALADAAVRVGASRRADACLIQRELLSTLPTLERFTTRPRILDVDDAIFLQRGGRTAGWLAQHCDRIVCGNQFLADWFGKFNPCISVIPTAIDTSVYVPRTNGAREGLCVGWIGTSSNIPHLQAVAPGLKRAMEIEPGIRLLVVSDRAPSLPSIPEDRIDYQRWSAGTEVGAIQGMDVGIMPLSDTPWARGKCSFKMLQYMACQLPVVVSPVGMNAEVLGQGELGLSASTNDDWCDSLLLLAREPKLRTRLGSEGRRVAVSTYGVPIVAQALATCLRS